MRKQGTGGGDVRLTPNETAGCATHGIDLVTVAILRLTPNETAGCATPTSSAMASATEDRLTPNETAGCATNQAFADRDIIPPPHAE